MPPQQPLLQIRDLNVGFDTSRGLVRPVRDVSLTIHPGQPVALVGESGCGKSVTSLSILRLIPSPPGKVLGGKILLEGRDLLTLSEREMRTVRGKDIAMIFQEPMTSLNPVYTIGDQIVEAVALHQGVGTRKAYEIAEQSLRDVGIADPHRRPPAYPHEMFGRIHRSAVQIRPQARGLCRPSRHDQRNGSQPRAFPKRLQVPPALPAHARARDKSPRLGRGTLTRNRRNHRVRRTLPHPQALSNR